jgi:hypothetical protein
MRFIVSFNVSGQVQVDAESEEDAALLVKKAVERGELPLKDTVYAHAKSLAGIRTYP